MSKDLKELADELWKMADAYPTQQRLFELKAKFSEYKKLYSETQMGDAKKKLMGMLDHAEEPDTLCKKLLQRFFKEI